jgi:hypothetical protein
VVGNGDPDSEHERSVIKRPYPVSNADERTAQSRIVRRSSVSLRLPTGERKDQFHARLFTPRAGLRNTQTEIKQSNDAFRWASTLGEHGGPPQSECGKKP